MKQLSRLVWVHDDMILPIVTLNSNKKRIAILIVMGIEMIDSRKSKHFHGNRNHDIKEKYSYEQ